MWLPEHDPSTPDVVVAVPQQIEQHARTVAGLSDRVAQAWHASNVVGLDAAAYGQMCAFLPRALAPLHERIAHTTRMAADASDHTATSLTAATNAYVGADENAAAHHQQLTGSG